MVWLVSVSGALTGVAAINGTAGWNATTDAVLKFAFTGTANSFAIV